MDFVHNLMVGQPYWLLIIVLVIGFTLLIFGADWLVSGASTIAKRLHISDMVIGLTIVALGTSMPELVVNLISVSQGTTDIAITNILGSNSINIFLILGLSALCAKKGIPSDKHSRNLDIPFAALSGVIVLLFVVIDQLRNGEASVGIDCIDGIILFGFFIFYMVLTFRHARKHPTPDTGAPKGKLWLAILLIFLGLAGLIIGGECCVQSAVELAHKMNIPESVIGLTIVALGTSLPELATSVVAAIKGSEDMALGNVVGSNIFNVFCILGISSMIMPLPSYNGLILDSVMAALSCVLVWLFAITDKKHSVNRWHGILLILIYAGYLTYRLVTMSV